MDNVINTQSSQLCTKAIILDGCHTKLSDLSYKIRDFQARLPDIEGPLLDPPEWTTQIVIKKLEDTCGRLRKEATVLRDSQLQRKKPRRKGPEERAVGFE